MIDISAFQPADTLCINNAIKIKQISKNQAYLSARDVIEFTILSSHLNKINPI